MSLLTLPLEKHGHARPCPACAGTGVTGERFEMPLDTGDTLLLEVICPQCGGCGNGDPQHNSCLPAWHADPENDDDLDDDGGPEGSCLSCGSGRGWYPVQGFTGDGDDAAERLVRQPCGCSESRLITVTGEAPA